MSEHGSDTRSPGSRWWLVGLGSVAVLALGVGIGNALASGDDPVTQAPTPDASAPSASSPAVARLVVTAGQGGSGRAADGKTPIGYQHTCEGAVAAATNYVSSATRLEWVKPYGDKLLDQISDADTQSIEERRTGMRTILEGGGVLESHPEWGGFRVVACDQYDATVDVWECEVLRANGQAQRSCAPIATAVAWVNGDWKLRRYQVPAEEPAPEPTPDPVPGDAPLSAEQRRQALQAAGPEWQEYANAPK
ncbi:hypothetical protein AB0C07_37915 [Actinoplanes missouriensis]|uniref:hypothetical protein n=1 Tax=Actinoplanes missouriensis TaxID=1866 RepID=UPI0033FB6702